MVTGRDKASTAGLRALWLGLVLLFGLLVGLATAYLYQLVLDRAEADLARSAVSYQRLIFNQIADLDRFVSLAARGLLVDESLSAEQTSALFRHRRETNPFIQDLLVIDAEGEVLALAWEGETPSVREREYFTHHRDHADSVLHISPPKRSLVYEDDWFISLSRALRSADGDLLGAAVGMFSVATLSATLEDLLDFDDLAITVMTDAGQLVLRLPLASAFGVGDDLTARADIDLPLAEPTTVHVQTALDEASRIVHFQPMPDYGLIIAASVTRSGVFATWRVAVVLATSIWLVFSLASLLLIRRLRNSIQQAQASQARFRKVVENASDVILLVDARGVIQYVSPNWKELLGHEPDEVIGLDSIELIHPEDQPRLGETLRSVVEDNKTLSGVEYRVRHADGHWLWHSASISLLEDADGNFDAVIGVVRDVTDSQRHRERLTQMALADPLTGLANRPRLSELIAQSISHAERTGRLLAVLFIDLDRFKPVNDLHGHEIGDQLLSQAARRIAGALRKPDRAARFGGDEFVVLLHDLSDPQEAIAIGERIAQQIQQPFSVKDLEITISCSIGVALFPSDGKDERELIMHADQAMYRVKQDGRSSIRRHRPASDQ